MHRLVATLQDPSPDRVARGIRDLPDGVAWAEVRLDAWWPGAPEPDAAADALLAATEAAAARGVTALATLRPRRQGGVHDGDEAARLNWLAAAARSGFGAVDVEADLQGLPEVVRALREHARHVVASDHRDAKAPGRDVALRKLTAMQDSGADMQKLAFPASSYADGLRAVELVHAHAARGGAPCVVPVGFGGADLRALLAVVGNVATYGHAPGFEAAAQGQPGVEALLHRWRHWDVRPDELGPEGGRGWFTVVGHPVAHSLSPRLHNAALRQAGRPERMAPLDVPESTGALRLLATVAPRLGLRGASVTAPHKAAALAVASQAGEAARDIGAANCLRFDGEEAVAANTDATAAQRLLAEVAGPGGRLVVLGAGGAARAAVWTGQRLDLETIFTSRDPERAGRLRDDLGADWVPWDERNTLRADAWVQATPLGSRPDDPDAVARDALAGARLAIELAYATGPTPFQHAAGRAGARVVDGTRFLREQAVDAYRFWTGEAPDRDAMARALDGEGGPA